MKTQPVSEKTEKVEKNFCKTLVYWHKGMNSGLWEYDNNIDAFAVAGDLAKQDQVYDVVIIDMTNLQKIVVKRVV